MSLKVVLFSVLLVIPIVASTLPPVFHCYVNKCKTTPPTPPDSPVRPTGDTGNNGSDNGEAKK